MQGRLPQLKAKKNYHLTTLESVNFFKLRDKLLMSTTCINHE